MFPYQTVSHNLRNCCRRQHQCGAANVIFRLSGALPKSRGTLCGSPSRSSAGATGRSRPRRSPRKARGCSGRRSWRRPSVQIDTYSTDSVKPITLQTSYSSQIRGGVAKVVFRLSGALPDSRNPHVMAVFVSPRNTHVWACDPYNGTPVRSSEQWHVCLLIVSQVTIYEIIFVQIVVSQTTVVTAKAP